MSRPLAALLAAALVLAACSGGEDPAPPPPPTEPAEPTADEPEEDEEPEQPDEPEDEEPEDDRPPSPLTGRPIDDELLETPLLQAKIENSPQARPQSGLEAADIVYEEVVEGGVTRFLAVFHSNLPDVAGPIRSARPVDTQLMGGYGRSGFAYSGARAEVQTMLAETPAIRVTEGGAGFFRDATRSAPHNLYIDAAATHADVMERDPDPVADVGWVFDDDPPDGAITCDQDDGDDAGSEDDCDAGASVSIHMSRYFTTGWDYDPDAELYRRSQDGAEFTVTGADAIGAANVVVLATRHYVGATGYPETDVITEEASGIVLRDGARYAITWTKPAASAPIELFTTDGEPFPLKPGSTWVHLPDAGSMPSGGS